MQFLKRLPRKIKVAMALVLVYASVFGVSSVVAGKADRDYSGAWFVNDEAMAAAMGTEELIKNQCSDGRARALQWEPKQLKGVDGTEKALTATPFVWVIWGNIRKVRQDTASVRANTMENIVYIDQATSDFLTYPH